VQIVKAKGVGSSAPDPPRGFSGAPVPR
jgi:hypothetical protein